MANTSNFAASTDGASVSGTVTDKQVVTPQVPAGLRSDGPRVTLAFRGEWNSGNTYYYYDVVRDTSGRSWICRYPQVPAGTALEEGTYWTNWADPNIEFEELAQLVATYDGRITENENGVKVINAHNTVIIGDSYTDLSNPNWTTPFAESNNLTVYKHATSSMAFHKTETWQSGEFVDNLNWGDYISKNPTEAEYVICYGGVNDTVKDSADIQAFQDAIENFITEARKLYTKAKIYIVGPQRGVTTEQDTLRKKVRAMRSACVNKEAVYINAANWQFWFEKDYGNYYMEDLLHPNEAGRYAIAEAFTQSIFGDGFKPSNSLNTITSASSSVVYFNESENETTFRIYVASKEIIKDTFIENDITFDYLNLRPGSCVETFVYADISGIPGRLLGHGLTASGTVSNAVAFETVTSPLIFFITLRNGFIVE